MSEQGGTGFTLGQTWTLDFSVSEADQLLFSELSGDRNALHLDAAAAVRAGFQGPVVFGALMVAKLSSIVGMHIPGAAGLWSGVQMDFRKPLFVGESATLGVELIQVSKATRSFVLKVSVRREGQLIASGRALATLL